MKIDTNKLIMEMARQEVSNIELAEMTGLTTTSISTLRKKGTCRGTTLGKVAKALKLDVTDLMEGADKSVQGSIKGCDVGTGAVTG